MKITRGKLKEYLDYNIETGVFTWIKRPSNRVKVGDIAGANSLDGYIMINLFCKSYKAHRLAWLYVYGNFPKNHIDHINHIRNDNRLENLREVDDSINSKNKAVICKNKSGCLGVSWVKERKKWYASIGVNGRCKSLGKYDRLEDAIAARKRAEIDYGYHKNHGVAA